MKKPRFITRRMLAFVFAAFFLLCATAVLLPLVNADKGLQVSHSSGPPGTIVTVSVDIRTSFYYHYKDKIGYEWQRDHMWEDYVGLKYLILWDLPAGYEDEPDTWFVIGEAEVDDKGLLEGEARIPEVYHFGEHTITAVYERNDEDYHSWWWTTFTPVTGYGGNKGNDGPSPCIIATAAYGGPLEQEVVYMRHVRDDLIGSTEAGRHLVEGWNTFYYLWSPSVAGFIAESKILRSVFKVLLTPLLGEMHIIAQEYHYLAWLNPVLASITAFITAAILTIAIYIASPILLMRFMIKHKHFLCRILKIKSS